MDELKLILSTRFMKGLVAKMIAKAIKKKTGYDITIQLNEIVVGTVDGKVCVHANVDAEIETEDFVQIVKSNNLI